MRVGCCALMRLLINTTTSYNCWYSLISWTTRPFIRNVTTWSWFTQIVEGFCCNSWIKAYRNNKIILENWYIAAWFYIISVIIIREESIMFMRIEKSTLSWIRACKTIIHVFIRNKASIFWDIIVKTLITTRSISKLICKFCLFFRSINSEHLLILSLSLITNTLITVFLGYDRLSLIKYIRCVTNNIICDVSILISVLPHFLLS
jgi:hypothetical protein